MPIHDLREKLLVPLQIYREKVRHVVGIAAGKGGVGKSTVTVQLAHALKKMGHRVGILDADLYGPSIPKMVPCDAMPRQEEGKLYPAYSEGIAVMSMAFFRKGGEAAAIRAPIATSLIRQFLEEIDWGPLDYLLVDFPPGTGDIPLTLCQRGNLSGVVMVTTPQDVAIIDVRKAIHLFQELKIPILGLVENMTGFVFGNGGGKRLAEEVKIPYFGEIPLDPSICQHGEEGKALDPETSMGKSFHNIAYNFSLLRNT